MKRGKMRVLVLNSGSSSIKFQLIDTTKKIVLVKGKCEKIGYKDSMYSFNDKKDIAMYFENHESALKHIVSLIDLNLVDAIGHRVVHGGELFKEANIITANKLEKLKEISYLAPLHNPSNVLGIEICMKLMPNKKNVAVFDTSFHKTIEKEKYIYPIPYEYYEKYSIRKYGFHGTSVKYVSKVADEMLNKKDSKIIVCHLGNGASITAVRNGKSVDTSMGFTPISGIPMGTRCGSIDPLIIEFLMKKGHEASEIFKILNEKSGMLGICNISDNRELTEAMLKGDERAKLAFNIYVDRIASYIGAYYIMLEGVDAIVFTGGIGENSKETREKICSKLKALNIKLDDEKNNNIKTDACISDTSSSVKIFRIRTDEEMMIAKDTENILGKEL